MLVHADPPQMITLAQTEIVGYIGENATVTVRVESCLSSIYKIQLFCPNGSEIHSTSFIDCPTYNKSIGIPMKPNSSGKYMVTIVNEHGEVQDSKSFRVRGNQVYIIVIHVTLWYRNDIHPD